MVGAGGTVIRFRRAADGLPIIDDALIAAWSNAVVPLADDDAYNSAAAIAREAGTHWRSASQRPAIAAWFASLLS